MTETVKVPGLSGPQRQRLSELSDVVLKVLKREHVARIKGEPDLLHDAINMTANAEARFQHAVCMRGFVVGDVVRVVVEGPYLNSVVPILEVEGQRIRLMAVGHTVLALPHEVEMVIAYEGEGA